MSDFTSVPFQLLKGVNYHFEGGSPSTFSILNVNKTIVVLTGNSKKVMIAVGSYKSSKLIAYPKSDLVEKMNKKLEKKIMGDNFVAFLVGRNCTKYLKCYIPIKEYRRYLGIRSLVVGINRQSRFNFTDFTNEVIKNDWHLIIAGTFWLGVDNNINNLAKLYGICITKKIDKSDFYIRHNICKNVTSFVNNNC